jgi:GNAT superfamily N-acetyltransferase
MTHLEIKVRLAEISDLALIRNFLDNKIEFDGCCINESKHTTEQLTKTIFGEQPLAFILLAEVGGIAVGFALFYNSYSSFLAQRCIWLEDLFVDAHMRGKGVGTALLKSLAEIAIKTKCGRIEWGVNNQNLRAIAFYQKQGAQIIEHRRFCRLDREKIALLAGS